MKKIGFLILAFSVLSFTNLAVIDEARINYDKVIKDKVLCKKMISELEKIKNNSVVNLAYLGGYKTIWANHVFSPIEKLKTFKEGKKLIDEAVLKEPNNIEIRFIRLSVQKNAPAFLGYKSNVKEDEEFIRKNRNTVSSEIISKNIDALLKR
jgi:hypothetical protein